MSVTRPRVTLVTLAAAACLAWIAVGADTQPAGETVDTVTTVLSPRRHAVLAAQVAGEVQAIHFRLGEAFERDVALVELDERAYRARVAAARAKRDAAAEDLAQVKRTNADQIRQRRARAIVEAAQANLSATERLHADGNASLVDLANARRDLLTAEADRDLLAIQVQQEETRAIRDLRIAESELALAEEALRHCRFAAPYAGRVARVLVNENETVQRHQPVLEIVDDRVLLAKFLAPSRYFARLSVGTRLMVAVPTLGEELAATVTHVAPVFDAVSRTVEIHAEIDNRDGRLRPGMNGRVLLRPLVEQ
jgi:multidrug efflux pump subunit AcrA (membrane-fusion protein)